MVIYSSNDVTGKTVTFDNVDTLIGFISDLHNFWSEIQTKWNEDNSSIFKNPNCLLKQYVTSSISNIELVSTELKKLEDQSEDQSNKDQWLRSQVSAFLQRHKSLENNRWLWHGHAFIEALKGAYEYSPECGNTYLQRSIDYAKGVQASERQRGELMAYEHAMQDDTDILSRRKLERKNLSALRKDLADRNNSLIDKTNKFESQLDEWKKEFTSNTQLFKEKQIKSLDDTQADRTAKFNGFFEESQKSIEDLEHTYEEKLRLSEPAKYWKNQSKNLFLQAVLWLVTLFIICGVCAYLINGILFKWTEAKQLDLKLDNIQGAVFFALLVSIMAFVIKTVTRLSMSAFHLQRDAKEREQLTCLYLSLGNETDFDEDSRRIVLQALFSRADTGLLTKDTSPTMPNVVDIMKVGKL